MTPQLFPAQSPSRETILARAFGLPLPVNVARTGTDQLTAECGRVVVCISGLASNTPTLTVKARNDSELVELFSGPADDQLLELASAAACAHEALKSAL